MSTDFFFGRKTGGGKQGFFKRIEPQKANGLEIFREIFFKKPVIQKSGLLFIGKVGLDDLSKKFGISRERVRQVEVRAFEKLRKVVKNLSYIVIGIIERP